MSTPIGQSKGEASIQSKDFRIVYTNSFAVRFGDNDVLLKFIIDTDTADPTAPNIEEVGVIMTPRSAKLLAYALTQTIEAYEAAAGPIAIPQEKLDSISEALQRPRVSR